VYVYVYVYVYVCTSVRIFCEAING